MASFKELKRIKEKVHMLLFKNPSLQDDDAKLEVAFRKRELRGKISSMSASHYLKLVASGKLTDPESIIRARRKLQEEYPSLRGKQYFARRNEEQVVRRGIKHL